MSWLQDTWTQEFADLDAKYAKLSKEQKLRFFDRAAVIELQLFLFSGKSF